MKTYGHDISEALKQLKEWGVHVTTHNQSLHFLIWHEGEPVIDYWPTTGKGWVRDKNNFSGFNQLKEEIDKLPPPKVKKLNIAQKLLKRYKKTSWVETYEEALKHESIICTVGDNILIHFEDKSLLYFNAQRYTVKEIINKKPE